MDADRVNTGFDALKMAAEAMRLNTSEVEQLRELALKGLVAPEALESDAKDAARYRFLRTAASFHFAMTDFAFSFDAKGAGGIYVHTSLDKAVDEAMVASQPQRDADQEGK